MPAYDKGKRRRAVRRKNYTGGDFYIPEEELLRAGFAPGDPPPFYKCHGSKRSDGGRSIIISLYEKES